MNVALARRAGTRSLDTGVLDLAQTFSRSPALARLIPDALERNAHLDLYPQWRRGRAIETRSRGLSRAAPVPRPHRDEAAGGHVGASIGAIALNADGIHGEHQRLFPS